MNQNRMNYYLRFMRQWTLVFLCVCGSIWTQAQNTPLAINGRLKLNGKQLVNQNGKAIQLRGMSTHGLQWFGNCATESSIKAMATDWGCDIVRAAMYVDEGGYKSNPQAMKDKVNQIAALAEANGMYCMIDWHILTPGNPWANINEAKAFFQEMAIKYSGKKHILYEICNEPNNIDWPSVKGYAEQIIPIIRQYDSEAIIIVGTPTWSGEPKFAADNPITGSYAYNLMYTFHFYAGTHYDHAYMNSVISRIPIFVTEWGTSNATGNGGNDYNNAQTWINLFAGGNSSGIKVSWCNWSFCDKNETSAALNGGACGAGQWNNTSTSGTWVKSRILSPADDFGGGPVVTPQAPYAGVIQLPGVLNVKNYDNGGEGVSFHDNDAANLGGAYRTNYGVDIEPSSESGHNIGWTAAGEWMEYTVNVASAGTYSLTARVASATTGGSFHIEMNGTNVSGTLNAPGTNGWQSWTNVSKNMNLAAGQQILRIAIDAGGFNLNNITFTAVTAPPPPSGLVNGGVYRIVAKHSGLACDAAGPSTANGANIQQWTYGGGANQKWTAIDLGNGYWRLNSVYSGKCMEVAGYSNANGGNVQQWDYVGHNHQQWGITSLGDGSYRVINRGSGLALDVAEVSFANGANVQQWSYGGGDNQKWYFQSVTNAKAALSNDVLETSEEKLYPNPAQDLVNINLGGFEGQNLRLAILDTKNNVVLEQNLPAGEKWYSLPLNNLPGAGVYFLSIKDEHQSRMDKLVVTH